MKKTNDIKVREDFVDSLIFDGQWSSYKKKKRKGSNWEVMTSIIEASYSGSPPTVSATADCS